MLRFLAILPDAGACDIPELLGTPATVPLNYYTPVPDGSFDEVSMWRDDAATGTAAATADAGSKAGQVDGGADALLEAQPSIFGFTEVGSGTNLSEGLPQLERGAELCGALS
jgi:hypothetical protein